MTETSKRPLTALQLVGSPTSGFFYDLSVLYAKEVIQPEGFKLLFVTAYPDGSWSVSESLTDQMDRISFEEMVGSVGDADLAVCHMFCNKGMISIRILFEDVLNIPIVGSSGHCLGLAQDKFLTKCIVEEAGVTVPSGKRFNYTTTDVNKLEIENFPVIVKPNSSDNSDGLSLVSAKYEMRAAWDKAGAFDESILVETYIPGREIRGALIKRADEFVVLPFIEYQVHQDNPIRMPEDKLEFNEASELIGQSKKENAPAICPAELDDSLKEELILAMKRAHLALGCRDYSMFDFRIHSETHRPYLLETGLFWSFSEKSMISVMLREADISLKEMTHSLWMQALTAAKK